MNKYFLVSLILITFISPALGTYDVFAQGGGTLPACDALPAGQTILQWPHCTIIVLGQLIVTVINAALAFGGILLLFNLFKSAMDYITSGDDTKKLEQARSNITWSIVGIFGIASVFMVFRFILDLIPGLSGLIQ